MQIIKKLAVFVTVTVFTVSGVIDLLLYILRGYYVPSWTFGIMASCFMIALYAFLFSKDRKWYITKWRRNKWEFAFYIYTIFIMIYGLSLSILQPSLLPSYGLSLLSFAFAFMLIYMFYDVIRTSPSSLSSHASSAA
jgi:hypothetical protein